MSELVKKCKSFGKLYPPFVFVIGFIGTYICHGAMLFSNAIGLDTDLAIIGNELYGGQGRQGIFWIRNILQISQFNLYLTEALTFLLLFLSPIIMLFFFHILGDEKREKAYVGIPFILIWTVSPFWTAQLYFLSQSVPVLVATILIPIAVLCAEYAYQNLKKRWWLALCAIALMQLIFSTYQLQILLYIMIVAALFLVLMSNNRFDFKIAIKKFVYHAVVFLIGFAIYMIIYKLFFNEFSGYLSDQIKWIFYGKRQSVINILGVFKDSLVGGDFYNITYFPGGLLLLIFAIINMRAEKRTNTETVLRVLLIFVLIMMPFVFPVLFGSDVVPRMKYIFSISQAIQIYILLGEVNVLFASEKVTTSKKKRGTLIALCAVLGLFFVKDIINNEDFSNRLYYTKETNYAHDLEIAKKVQKDVKQYIIDNDLPYGTAYERLVFLGTPQEELNEMCVSGSGAAMEGSFWEWGAYSQLIRDRIYYFMDCTGYGLDRLSYFSDSSTHVHHLYFKEFFGEEVEEMPFYPFDGYIKYMKDEETTLEYLVVKMGPNWSLEIDMNQ